MQKTPQTKKIVILAVAAILLLSALVASYFLWFPKGEEGSKTLSVEVVFADDTQKDYTLHTDAAYLKEALDEESLIAGDESTYGYYIHTVDGVKADESQQQWWCITKSGEMVMTGASDTPVADGDAFELTLMTGYDETA